MTPQDGFVIIGFLNTVIGSALVGGLSGCVLGWGVATLLVAIYYKLDEG